jgi:hypothetical protein
MEKYYYKLVWAFVHVYLYAVNFVYLAEGFRLSSYMAKYQCCGSGSALMLVGWIPIQVNKNYSKKR